jgi:hypothetical protein
MAARQRNYVHFALMGRDDISMDILKAVNGITKECKITYHGTYSIQYIPQRSNYSQMVGRIPLSIVRIIECKSVPQLVSAT